MGYKIGKTLANQDELHEYLLAIKWPAPEVRYLPVAARIRDPPLPIAPPIA